MIVYTGNIVFANGNGCAIYTYSNGAFTCVKRFNACLQKRQSKCGQSAQRIERLAEETRHMYVTKIIDNTNKLVGKILLFGSDEITAMVMAAKHKTTTIKYAGFLEFDTNTIKDTRKWLEYLTETDDNDKIYECVLLYLDTNVDLLDFDMSAKDTMKFYLSASEVGGIPFPDKSSKYYSRLCGFEYIGVKYYNYMLDFDECADEA